MLVSGRRVLTDVAVGSRRSAGGRVVAVLFVASLALGFAVRSPILGWIGLVLTAYAVAQPLENRAVHAALLLASSVGAALLRYGFVWKGLRLFGAGADTDLAALSLGVSAGLVDRWVIAAVVLVAPVRWRARSWGVAIWMPAAWLVGERCMASIMLMELNGWLLTQARVPPIVHLVSWVGQTATALVALTIGCIVAGVLAHRRANVLASLLVAAALSFAIPPRRRDASALNGVAALRLQRRAEHVRGLDASVVVWPEAVSTRPLSLEEGPVDASVAPPGDAPSTHILGAVNHRGERAQNSAIVATHDGRALWHRAKISLAAVGEASRFGLRVGASADLLPGAIEPVVSVGERRIGVLICSELLDRTMRERATPEGVELLVVLAGDAITGDHPAGRELMLNAAIFAAAEQSVSIARASSRGVAALIGPDGTVYARVDDGHLRAASLPTSPR